MKILFLGPSYGVHGHRAEALKRLGHSVRLLDPDQFLPPSRLAAKLHWETGGLLSQKSITAQTLRAVEGETFDLTWVDGGRYVGPDLVQAIRRQSGPVIGYNQDDPFGRRDRGSWSLFLRTVPFYDLLVVLRDVNVPEAYARGAKKVLRVFFAADEAAHAPRLLTPDDHTRWDSEVLFIGTWMEKRGAFLADLIRRGVPLSIYGNRWQRAAEWPLLRHAWKGPGTATDDDYAKAIQCSKVCLGLLSKGNRDLHTTRSLEVPLLGGVLCAERTVEHQQLYREGEEAMFWSDAAECADACRKLLEDEDLRRRIAERGRVRNLANGHANEKIESAILSAALGDGVGPGTTAL